MNEEPIEGELVGAQKAQALSVLPKGLRGMLEPLQRSEYPLSLTTGQAVEQAALAAEAFSQKFLPAILKTATPRGFVRYGNKITIWASGVRTVMPFFGFCWQLQEVKRIPEAGPPGSTYAYKATVLALSQLFRTAVEGIGGRAESTESYSKGRKGKDVTQGKEEDSVRQTAIMRAVTRAFRACCGLDDIPHEVIARAGWKLTDIPDIAFGESKTPPPPPPQKRSNPASARPKAPRTSITELDTAHHEVVAQLTEMGADDPAFALACQFTIDGRVVEASGPTELLTRGHADWLRRVQERVATLYAEFKMGRFAAGDEFKTRLAEVVGG